MSQITCLSLSCPHTHASDTLKFPAPGWSYPVFRYCALLLLALFPRFTQAAPQTLGAARLIGYLITAFFIGDRLLGMLPGKSAAGPALRAGSFALALLLLGSLTNCPTPVVY